MSKQDKKKSRGRRVKRQKNIQRNNISKKEPRDTKPKINTHDNGVIKFKESTGERRRV